MKPSDKITPILESGNQARMQLLVKHRKAAYLDVLARGTDAEVIGRRWRKYKEARDALARMQKGKT